MKKVLFLDRDGTIIVEPPEDKQVDSLHKLKFVPGVISALRKIVELDQYELVLVSNQDGLGTNSFPEADFWPAHNMMRSVLATEGIEFFNEHIDRSLPEDKLDSRKPGTAMLTEYLQGGYDLANSFVIGDRITDVQLAINLGTRSIFFSTQEDSRADLSTNSWNSIYEFVRASLRCSKVIRETSETKIELGIALDGSSKAEISTGLGFFDHMLEQIVRHSGCDLSLLVEGDLDVDEHHTIEDTGLALGQAVRQALGDKRGIARYGALLPMDDCLAQVALDFSGRPWCVWDAEFNRERIGDVPCEMFFHFFKSFSDEAKCNLNISAQGNNEHHKIESIFKAFAKTIKQAWQLEGDASILPSTKGTL